MQSRNVPNFEKRAQDLKTYCYLMFDHACRTRYMYTDVDRQVYGLRGLVNMSGSMSGWENYLRKVN